MKDATILYLENEGALTSTLKNYFIEAAEIGKLRKFNFSNYDNTFERKVDFDFVHAEKEGFLFNPSAYKIKTKNINLYFDDKQKNDINDMKMRYRVNSLHDKGKFYQKGNSMLLNRRIEYA